MKNQQDTFQNYIKDELDKAVNKLEAEATANEEQRLADQRANAPFPELSLEEVDDRLSIIIKHDWENKLITFFAMLAAYTHDSQLNISFNAPSASGKTFITTSIAKLFPSDDKIELMRASPTALTYKEGIVDEKTGATIVPLTRKIIIFYELPSTELQKMVRSVASHDNWENRSLLTNKDKKGANRAQEIILLGFPTMIFCSAGLKLDEQDANRSILLSPEISDEKLAESLHFTALRNSGDESYLSQLNDDPRITDLKKRIEAIRDVGVEDIYIPNIAVVKEQFIKSVGKTRPRHNRDLDHLLKLIKSITLLNLWYRYDASGRLVASEADITSAFQLWAKIADSQERNIPPALMQFYKKFIIPAWYQKLEDPDFRDDMNSGLVGITREELSMHHLRAEGVPLNWDYLRHQILPQLKVSGLILEHKPESGDKRSTHIYPQWFPNDNNIGSDGRNDRQETNPIIDPFDH